MKAKTFFAIALSLFAPIFVAPLVANAITPTGALLAYAAMAFVICMIAKERISSGMKLLALMSGWVLYALIGAVYFIMRGATPPPVETMLVLVPVVVLGFLVGWAVYALRSTWLKISFTALFATFAIFMVCGGEKACENRLYYGAWNGEVNEPVSPQMALVGLDANAVNFDMNGDSYSVVQLFHPGYGHSLSDVEKFTKPALEKYKNDPRVKFMVVGISSGNEYEKMVSGKQIGSMGLPYAQSTEPDKLIKELLYSPNATGVVVIIKKGMIIFRGDGKMAMKKLEELQA